MIVSSTMILAGVIGVFGLFMATLGWAMWYTRDAGTYALAHQQAKAPHRAR